MCIYPKAENTFPSNYTREEKDQKKNMDSLMKCSVLLELAAFDDVDNFVREVEEKGKSADEAGFWYGHGVGTRKMGIEERTPLMIGSMYGSLKIVQYITGTGKADVNRACGSDGVTALHCAAAGGSYLSLEVAKCLLDASADINCVDAKGNRPVELIVPGLKSAQSLKRKTLEMLLKGISCAGDEMNQEVEQQLMTPRLSSEKKEYPVDISLPDINEGVYGTDEFRMYSFKVKPCSRAYSHDWTECPFVHPGENARRRDPRKYPYTCVPCPEFRKGSCKQGDACEYAHGVFESWLHPAQYRTRLCKDEVGCGRKVCFFAHKSDELRPVYASTGSAMPSPKSLSSYMDMGALNPSPHGSLNSMMPPTSTPPMSPAAATASPKSGNLWQNNLHFTPPMLQLPGSRLKTASSARDMEFEMEMIGLENQHRQQQQRLMNEITCLSSPTSWNKQQSRIGDLNPTNLDDSFGSLDMSLLSKMQGISTQIQSPTGIQVRQSLNQQHGNYLNSYCSSPVRKQPPSFGFDSSAAVAAALMNSRTSAFANRSQSFVDRSMGNSRAGLTGSGNSMNMTASNVSDWNSPSGRLDWSMHGEDLNKLRKSVSFGHRSNNNAAQITLAPSTFDEPDVSWVNSLVKDAPGSEYCSSPKKQSHYRREDEAIPAWMEQMYIEKEQMVA